jgi:hypothetical protein
MRVNHQPGAERLPFPKKRRDTMNTRTYLVDRILNDLEDLKVDHETVEDCHCGLNGCTYKTYNAAQDETINLIAAAKEAVRAIIDSLCYEGIVYEEFYEVRQDVKKIWERIAAMPPMEEDENLKDLWIMSEAAERILDREMKWWRKEE